MSMPCGGWDPDKDFRLLFDEVDRKYYIQKRRLIIGWKFIEHWPIGMPKGKLEFTDINEAKKELDKLRIDHKKRRVKRRYVVLDA